ncbi:hypothetical protein M6B38_171570 [Iris pallida]|uniref:Uncharacterized protein n=1 Tax=Iris pallida TaxID=29817 RepID=A0AAX6EU67_IRIPA|nr:hypothetical protein M6B38_171570 [Iris pallida]
MMIQLEIWYIMQPLARHIMQPLARHKFIIF